MEHFFFNGAHQETFFKKIVSGFIMRFESPFNAIAASASTIGHIGQTIDIVD